MLRELTAVLKGDDSEEDGKRFTLDASRRKFHWRAKLGGDGGKVF